jgi:hypothetical protein
MSNPFNWTETSLENLDHTTGFTKMAIGPDSWFALKQRGALNQVNLALLAGVYKSLPQAGILPLDKGVPDFNLTVENFGGEQLLGQVCGPHNHSGIDMPHTHINSNNLGEVFVEQDEGYHFEDEEEAQRIQAMYGAFSRIAGLLIPLQPGRMKLSVNVKADFGKIFPEAFATSNFNTYSLRGTLRKV